MNNEELKKHLNNAIELLRKVKRNAPMFLRAEIATFIEKTEKETENYGTSNNL